MSDAEVRRHFDRVAPEYDRWKERARYYYAAVKVAVGEVVPTGRSVLEVGCGTGDVLASLQPARGVGIDISPEMISRARVRHPDLAFHVHDIVAGPLDDRFEFVVAVDVLEHVADLDGALRSMAAMLGPDGVLAITTANVRWSAILHLAERLRLKMPEGEHEWRPPGALRTAAADAGLQETSFARSLLVPKSVPVVKGLTTPAGRGPLRLGLIERVTFVPSR